MWSVPGSGLSPNRLRAPQAKDTVRTITGPSAAMVFTSTSFSGRGLFLQTKLRSHCLVEARERSWSSQHPSLLPQPGGLVYKKHGWEMVLDTQQVPWIFGSFQQLRYQGNLCPVLGVDRILPALAPPLLSSPLTSGLSLGRTGPVLLAPSQPRRELL